MEILFTWISFRSSASVFELTLKSIYFMDAVCLPFIMLNDVGVAFMYWGLIIKHKIVGIKMFWRQTQKSQHKKSERKKNVVFIGEQNLFANKWWKSPLTGKCYGCFFLLYMFGASREVCSLFINFAVWGFN